MLIMVKTKARRGKVQGLSVLEPGPKLFQVCYVRSSAVPPAQSLLCICPCIMPRCDFALEKLTTLFKKVLRQATSHPAQPDASVRQVSVSISVAALASDPAPLSLSVGLTVCQWRFVSLCSISGAANAHNVNYYNEPKQASQAQGVNSQLS